MLSLSSRSLTLLRPALSLLGLSALALSSTACGGSLDEEDARAFWGSVEQSLSPGGSGGNSVSQALSVDMEFDVACRNGGTATFDGELDTDVSTGAGGSATTFRYDVFYDKCSPDENTLDGAVTYASLLDSEASSGSASIQYLYSYRGQLVVTGETQGECDFDVQGSVVVDVLADSGSASSDVEVEYTGYLCGHDAEQILDERYESHVSVSY